MPGLPTEEEAQRPAVIYLYRYGRPEAIAVERSSVDSSGRALLDALLAPLTPAEKSLRFTTSIPEGTDGAQLRGVRGHGERRPLAGVRARPVREAIYQLVYTLTSRPALRQVDISVDGVPFDLGGGLTGPITRDLADVLVRCAGDPTTPLDGEPCDLAAAPDRAGPAAVLPRVPAATRPSSRPTSRCA